MNQIKESYTHKFQLSSILINTFEFYVEYDRILVIEFIEIEVVVRK
ncbi:hypothetical protein JOC95_003618 [Bacillus tianshenii]|uniref:Uncharacterized protein n=1 Tax=Sutcliffiella tianshenii TaxID=1463404 RepID=A0ABS2P5N4_9BACI|nr:hypothetical protein [Bacillus tianshenii]